ncbi:uracil-DNA glycosylase [Alkalicoccobacillus plakortidis]|uniref:Uracil-DNA glycosylase n=1 Tax=Alkalicoccobacillus plakortidis TaxID=444060 RepID=A0ABT0XJV3_9BACI|nr:uracil-DNA glycosylase [Alkalicoccobacillus plakortidis]MCM2676035.1 uracil-DNA glycosylase [Alkalicoccobacillus plakortidis]
MSILNNQWQEQLSPEFEKPYYLELREFLKEEYNTQSIYPPMQDLFNALHLTDFQDVKVVIIGQDPYHGPGQAHGLSFSVQSGVKCPPSLKNIYKELQSDLGFEPPDHGNLVPWAKQGVLLLNTVLTVRQGEPASHRGKGWEYFTNAIIDSLNDREQPVCFLLWGKHAELKGERVINPQHLILTSPHPSPFSARRGFFGSRPFSTINKWLEQQNLEPINWKL